MDIVVVREKKLVRMPVSSGQTIGDIKAFMNNWLLPQGYSYKVKTFTFNNGVTLDPSVFLTDKYDDLDLEEYKGKIEGGTIKVTMTPDPFENMESE